MFSGTTTLEHLAADMFDHSAAARSSFKCLCASREILTSDNVNDTTVRIDTADLFGMCWVHLHLPTEEESWKKNTLAGGHTLLL